MGLSTLLVFLLVCVKGLESACKDENNCNACASRRSWLPGSSCRWCVLNGACHAMGSHHNPCHSSQNIKDSNKCHTVESNGNYNKEEAYRQLLLSAVAYSDTPHKCLQNVKILEDYKIENVVIKKCSDVFWSYKMCMAYVAVSRKRKDIVVAFSGTKDVTQLVTEAFSVLLKPKVSSPIGGHVQKYFKDAFDNLYPCLKDTLKKVMSKNQDYVVKITGHSLGAAIASVTSSRLVSESIVKKEQMTLYTFGMPRVGNREYAINHDKLVDNSFRVVHNRDIVVHLPSCKFISCFDPPYHHRTEIFYPNTYMTVNSNYKTCSANEDPNCSNGAINNHWCTSGMTECINDHTNYFNRPVGSHCNNILKGQRFGRSASDISFTDPGIAVEDKCRVYTYDGSTWTMTSRGTSLGRVNGLMQSCLIIVTIVKIQMRN